MVLKIQRPTIAQFPGNSIIIPILFTMLLFSIPIRLCCEDTGCKYFKNYTYKEYDHQPQNWGIAQAPNGIIYVANHGGILEYDGVSWRVIGIPGYSPALSLTIDKTGTIYVGGIGDIGYLAPDENGTLLYHSLRPYLPQSQSKFSDVRNIYITEKGIYFKSPEFLFRWQPQQQKMRVMEPKKRFYLSFLCAGKLFIRQDDLGLVEIIDDTPQPVPDGDKFIDKRIYMMAPYEFPEDLPHKTGTPGTQSLLIGTDTEGFYLYDGVTINPYPTEVDGYLHNSKLYHGIRLSNGDYALATERGGLVVMDPGGHLKYTWDKTSGLLDDCVYYVFEDREENLWLCLSKGLAKIENASPLSIHDERSGLKGIVLSVIKHHNDLYVGTIDGLFYLKTPARFAPVPGITGNCWSLASCDGSLLTATSEGVFQVEKEPANQRQVIKDQALVLCPSTYYPNRTWCGTIERLVALSRDNGKWREEYRYKSINQQIRTIAEEKNGSIWLITNTGSVIKMEFPTGIDQPVVTWYETSHGLPGGRVYAAPAAGHIMFATEKGLYRFDEQNKIFVPDSTIGGEFTGGPDTRSVFRIVEDNWKNIWIHSKSRNFQAIPTPGLAYTIYDTPFRRIPLIQVNAIYPDLDGKTIWFAGTEGLIRYDTRVKKDYGQPFPTLLRKILVNEEIIRNRSKNGAAGGKAGKPPDFTYSNRNFLFEFTAPFFQAENETLYRCFLEGYDKKWSGWNKDNKRNYTNLDPGSYTFKVQAKNIYGSEGSTDEFRFKVLPPWYREWWAFLLYIAGVVSLGFLGVKWRSAKLEQEKQRLEYTVKERTKEIQAKNLQLKEQSEKLKELDNVKSRFFANLSHEFRTPLTLIMGPLEQMLSDGPNLPQKQQLDVMLRNAQRLLGLINRLLELSRFDSGQVKLQATRQDIIPFLKGILSTFQLAARKNRLELEFHSEMESRELVFDAPKMEEVMYNLLINAFRYTSPGGKITISVIQGQERGQEGQDRPGKGQPEPGFLDISVRDTGIGIAKEQLPFIFDRFYQAQGTRGPKQEVLKGTGIGLSLVRENVVLHHGKIDVHSQEGKGTEFVIRLPLGHGHLKPEEIVDADAVPTTRPTTDGELESLLISAETETAAENEEETGKNTAGEGVDNENRDREDREDREKPVILVVEDHVEVRKYICDALKPDYVVIEAGNGREGIDKAREIIPDLVVSDIMMPEVNGIQLCRELKTNIKTSHIPIILLTAKAAEESIIEGYETGADDYITKPFNAKIVLTRIRNLIDIRRRLQEKIQKQMLLQPVEIAVSSMDRQFIEEIQNVIEKNLSDPDFNVEQLSKKLYMNRVTVYRKMTALTGETPTEFIRSYRLKRAAQLLRDGFGNVSQVSMEVGFSNMAYFARCFKEKFQQLPSSYQASESK